MSEQLAHFEQRRFEHQEIVALILDCKYLRKNQVIIALGITITGEKIALGFVQAGNENAIVVSQFMETLVERGLDTTSGLLVVVDGSKGLSKGVKDYFGEKAVIQRCRWHKRENVLSYLREEDKEWVKNRYDTAVNHGEYGKAKAELEQLSKELSLINISASRSLEEGMKELLTLQKLGLNEKFKRSFGTTNIQGLLIKKGQVSKKSYICFFRQSNMRKCPLALPLR